MRLNTYRVVEHGTLGHGAVYRVEQKNSKHRSGPRRYFWQTIATFDIRAEAIARAEELAAPEVVVEEETVIWESADSDHDLVR